MVFQFHSLRTAILEVLDTIHLLFPARAIYNTVFRYWLNIPLRMRNARFKRNTAPDGLPIPSPRLTFLVGGNYDLEAFYYNGKEGAECITRILNNNNISMNQFSSILDFGCGCGRVIRHWSSLKTCKLNGTDYNSLPIQWLRAQYPFAEFHVNGLQPPTNYQQEQFDFIYAISVFTHLDTPLQHAWLGELTRILIRGGYCYLTFLGTSHLSVLTEFEREQFLRGEPVVRRARHPGTNLCLAYHPEAYVRKITGKDFSVVDFVPGGAKDAASQDVFLLKKN